MFSILEKYAKQDCFDFYKDQNLADVCTAPKDLSGVYLVFAEKKIFKNLIYIGYSGKMQQNGQIHHRKGGLKQRIVHGHQFGGKRIKTWRERMVNDKISLLKICWYITFNNDN